MPRGHQAKRSRFALSVAVLFMAVCLVVFSRCVFALEFGAIHLNSSLGESLSARVPLLSITPEARDSLTAYLGDEQLYRQYKMHRNDVVDSINVDVKKSQGDSGKVVLKLSTLRPIRAPLLELLIVVETNHSRVAHQYTLFLEPRDWQPGDNETTAGNEPASHDSVDSNRQLPGNEARADKPVQSGPTPEIDAAQNTDSAAEMPSKPDINQRAVTVESGQTLWDIARSLHYDAISIYRVAVAIYRKNPDAFSGSISQLQAGSRLSMPTRSAIKQVDRATARALVNQSETQRLEQLVAKMDADQYLSPGDAEDRARPVGMNRAVGADFGTLAIPEQYRADNNRLRLVPTTLGGSRETAANGTQATALGRLSGMPADFTRSSATSSSTASAKTPATTPGTAGNTATRSSSKASNQTNGVVHNMDGQPSSADHAESEGQEGEPSRQVRSAGGTRQSTDSIPGYLSPRVILWLVAILSLLAAAGLWLKPQQQRKRAPEQPVDDAGAGPDAGPDA